MSTKYIEVKKEITKKSKSDSSFNGTYLQYCSDSDAYFKSLLLKKYFEKMKTHFIDIIGELKSTRSSWKIKLIVWLFFRIWWRQLKVETEMFIHSIPETVMWETDSKVHVDHIIKSVVNKYNSINKQT